MADDLHKTTDHPQAAAAIIDAVQAAALAVMDDAQRDYANRYHAGQPGRGAERQAGRTIAAFLRALPSGPLRIGRQVLIEDWQTLAWAVEAATNAD